MPPPSVQAPEQQAEAAEQLTQEVIDGLEVPDDIGDLTETIDLGEVGDHGEAHHGHEHGPGCGCDQATADADATEKLGDHSHGETSGHSHGETHDHGHGHGSEAAGKTEHHDHHGETHDHHEHGPGCGCDQATADADATEKLGDHSHGETSGHSHGETHDHGHEANSHDGEVHDHHNHEHGESHSHHEHGPGCGCDQATATAESDEKLGDHSHVESHHHHEHGPGCGCDQATADADAAEKLEPTVAAQDVISAETQTADGELPPDEIEHLGNLLNTGVVESDDAENGTYSIESASSSATETTENTDSIDHLDFETPSEIEAQFKSLDVDVEAADDLEDGDEMEAALTEPGEGTNEAVEPDTPAEQEAAVAEVVQDADSLDLEDSEPVEALLEAEPPEAASSELDSDPTAVADLAETVESSDAEGLTNTEELSDAQEADGAESENTDQPAGSERVAIPAEASINVTDFVPVAESAQAEVAAPSVGAEVFEGGRSIENVVTVVPELQNQQELVAAVTNALEAGGTRAVPKKALKLVDSMLSNMPRRAEQVSQSKESKQFTKKILHEQLSELAQSLNIEKSDLLELLDAKPEDTSLTDLQFEILLGLKKWLTLEHSAEFQQHGRSSQRTTSDQTRSKRKNRFGKFLVTLFSTRRQLVDGS